jgi:recombination protein RecR
MKDGVKPCSVCHNLTEEDVCSICMTDSRHKNLICVVEDIRDLLAIENIGNYRGSFHVLGGVISPMDGVGPSDLFITTLVDRMGEIKGDVEIIFALPATMEGDTTAFYLYKKLKDFEGVKITSLARGVAVGEALQHADEATLSRSLDNRTIYQA